jgi:hypothetical protein
MAPAWAAARPKLANALKGEDTLARPGRRISLRNLLVVGQIAMSVVLLSITGLFLRSLQSAASIDIGFRSKGLLMMSVDPRVHGYDAPSARSTFSPNCSNALPLCPACLGSRDGYRAALKHHPQRLFTSSACLTKTSTMSTQSSSW